MEKLYLVTHDERLRVDMFNLLQPFARTHLIEEAATLAEVSKRSGNNTAAAVVYAVDWLTEVEAKRVMLFRTQCLEAPLILFAQKDSNSALVNVQSIPWALFIEIPYSVESAQKTIARVLEHKDTRQAVHRRYPTTTNGWLEQGARKIPVTLANISLGGACCLTASKDMFKPGSNVSLRVNLTELGRERVMPAQVVWARFEEDQSQKVGLQFKSI